MEAAPGAAAPGRAPVRRGRPRSPRGPRPPSGARTTRPSSPRGARTTPPSSPRGTASGAAPLSRGLGRALTTPRRRDPRRSPPPPPRPPRRRPRERRSAPTAGLSLRAARQGERSGFPPVPPLPGGLPGLPAASQRPSDLARPRRRVSPTSSWVLRAVGAPPGSEGPGSPRGAGGAAGCATGPALGWPTWSSVRRTPGPKFPVTAALVRATGLRPAVPSRVT